VIPGDEDDAAAIILYGPSLKRAVTIELNAFTTRAPGARPATTSLAPLPPRSASTSLGVYEMNGFVASMSTRPFLLAGSVARPRHSAGNGEQDIVEACGLPDRSRGRSVPKLSNLANKGFWTTPAAQGHLRPVARASARTQAPPRQLPIVPNFMICLLIVREINENDAGRPA